MNIIEKIEYHKKMYEELCTLPDSVDLYLSSYDIDNKSVEEMMQEFFHVFGKYKITNKDFVYVAKVLGYTHIRTCVEGKRFYTLTRGDRR